MSSADPFGPGPGYGATPGQPGGAPGPGPYGSGPYGQPGSIPYGYGGPVGPGPGPYQPPPDPGYGPAPQGQPPGEVSIAWYDQGQPERPSHLRTLLLIGAAMVVAGALVAVLVVIHPWAPAAGDSADRGGTNPGGATQEPGGGPTGAGSTDPSGGFPTGGPATGQPSDPNQTATSQPKPDFGAAVATTSQVVVRVLAVTCQGTGVGTGFWLNANTVVTSYQSVAQAVTLAVLDKSGNPTPATIRGVDPATGVALLSATASRSPAQVHFDTAVPLGSWLAVVGVPSKSTAPRGTAAKVTGDGITATTHRVRTAGLAKVQGSRDLGLGGAPAVNARGQIVGAVYASAGDRRRLVVPSNSLTAGIQAAAKSGQPAKGGCGRPRGPQSENSIHSEASSAVTAVMKNYFGGINSGDYQRTFNTWTGRLRGYRSTVPKSVADGWIGTYDFNVRVRSSSRSGSGTTAWVTFDSLLVPEHRPKGAPAHLHCARWSLDFSLLTEAGKLRINGAKAHSGSRAWREC